MKKLFLALIVLTVIATPAFAQRRGALPNLWASWVSATTTPTVMDLPLRNSSDRFTSRDIFISNGDSSTLVCVDLKGGASIPHNCVTDSDDNPSIIQIKAGEDITLQDYITTGITLSTLTSTASPVTVVVTY